MSSSRSATVMEPGSALKAFLLISFLGASAASSSTAIVNGSTRLACNTPCHGDITVDYAYMGSKILVIRCEQGSCHTGDAFKNRAQKSAVSSIHLNPVLFSDDGNYIISCNNTWLCQQKLDVIAPVPVNAAVGENVTIQLYARTEKNITDKDIVYQCEKDANPVVKLQKGIVSYGTGYEGRVSVSLDQYRNGDVSLTLLKVQETDAGIIRCTHRHEEAVQPEAVDLTVTVSTLTTMPPKALEKKALEEKTWPWWAILLENIFLLLLLLCGYLLFGVCQRKRKKQRQISAVSESLWLQSNVV
ncbi:uncharacterized protein LOC124379631 isoform X2 [Silurus meridionalis]|uniref:uncharacterized protein LOC124379631 isoform X2 n=1 Tax=Silurus meridionalis TaxID=175797 RepID=UPI001EEA9FE7|nr:uncharacterized protein LOC124379631 isoform X2 [Silurus meridionalis]